MVSRFRSWWQQIKQHRVAIGVVGVVLVVVIVLIIDGYSYDWTGFNGYNQITIAHTTSGPSAGTVVRTEVYQPGKALWDWLQLLIIPVVLVVGGFLLNYTTSRNEQRTTTDNQREAALQAYIDKMSELLLHEKLRDLAEENEVRKIARVRTLTILPRLDADRKRSVLQFLYEAGLINKDKCIIELNGADLREVNLGGVSMRGHFREFFKFEIGGVSMLGGDQEHDILRGVSLRGASLRGANLFNANLYGADLSDTDLSDTDLRDADLRRAHLISANLFNANLRGANLKDALTMAIGPNSNIHAVEELEKRAMSLAGAIMPDGSIHL